MEQTKMNLFKELFYSVAKPKQYYKLSKVSGGRLTGFVFLFLAIVTIFTSAIPFSNTLFGSDGIFNMLEEKIPEFEMKDGVFHVSERYENADANNYVLVDTNIDKFFYDDIDQSYDEVFLVSKSNCFSYQENGKLQEINFSNFKEFDFNKDTIQDMKPFIIFIFVLVLLLIYLFGVGAYFFTALLYALIGLIVNSSTKAHLSFGTIFKIAIFSKVTIKILYALIGFLPLTIPSLAKNIVAIIVTCIYIVFGILSHNSNEAKEYDNLLHTNDNI